jgi:hypothetical protein
MKTEDIVEMIEKAGLCEPRRFIDNFIQLERFAKLVASAERDACAGLAERRMLIDKNKDKRIGHHHACKTIAEDIRSRGQA